MLWMLCGASYTLSVASAYSRTSSSASWGYQPVYQSVSYDCTPYATPTTTTSSAYRAVGTSATPNYNFKTTSVYHVSDARYQRMYLPGEMVVYGSLDDPPSGPGLGELEDEEDPLPLGEPLILLLFALIYVVSRQPSARSDLHQPHGI